MKPEISSEEAARLARQFAPVLVFHPDEQYFPCSPLFALDPGASGSVASQLGSPESRTSRYQTLTTAEKAKLATVYYRAYRLTRTSFEAIVLEYWFYYVQDTYRVRGNLLPFWFDGSHPNDMEHVRIVLRSSDQTVAEIYSSAHEGRTPSNRYRFGTEKPSERTHILVEHGSHANASDINQDGLFTPQTDGDSGYKIVWGILDKGISWIWYSDANMTPRGPAPVLFSPQEGEPPASGYTYRLESAQRLNMDMKSLQMTDGERKAAFETHVSWFTRVLGRSNGNADRLTAPPEPDLRRKSIDGGKFASTERGILGGITNLMPGAGFFIGGRYSFQNRYRFLPDLMLEADGIVNTSGKGYLSTDAMLTYPIDATTRLMFGTGVVTDSITYKQYERDWIAAGEVRLGRVRIYGASRSWGPITKSAVDFRMSFFF